jgi:hypothetical protein
LDNRSRTCSVWYCLSSFLVPQSSRPVAWLPEPLPSLVSLLPPCLYLWSSSLCSFCLLCLLVLSSSFPRFPVSLLPGWLVRSSHCCARGCPALLLPPGWLVRSSYCYARGCPALRPRACLLAVEVRITVHPGLISLHSLCLLSALWMLTPRICMQGRLPLGLGCLSRPQVRSHLPVNVCVLLVLLHFLTVLLLLLSSISTTQLTTLSFNTTSLTDWK